MMSEYTPFFLDLKTTSWRLSATTTLTGSSLTSGMGSDLVNGVTFPSCMVESSQKFIIDTANPICILRHEMDTGSIDTFLKLPYWKFKSFLDPELQNIVVSGTRVESCSIHLTNNFVCTNFINREA